MKFPNYKVFININKAYSNFIQKPTFVIDDIAPCKTKRAKVNSKEWSDSVASEVINNREQNFKKLKNSRLLLDQENYKNSCYEVKKIVAEIKRIYTPI